ncbi:MAG: NAD(P)H-binding protein, partial [Burkholderiaceae bacterium]|nr:NAD(P)H-binding protein [Burkholderiaceae bacterium]
MQEAKDAILLIGASGRTGLSVWRYLCAAAVPVIACVRRRELLPPEPRLAAAEVVEADVEQPGAFAPLFERAAHVIYVAGAPRKSLSAGAWQVEVEGLAVCLVLAQRTAIRGRWIYVGHDGAEPAGTVTWAESRWRELKREAEQAVIASGVNYFILRTSRVTDLVHEEPRVVVSQPVGPAPEGEIPCNALALLLAGAALAGASPRARASVRVDPSGVPLQEAVEGFL